jgi:predicted outer membrane repeat protein
MLVYLVFPMIPMVFEKNVANTIGGVIQAEGNSAITTLQGSFIFRNNTAINQGGAIIAWETRIEMGHCHFMNNSAGINVGAIVIKDSILTFRNSVDDPTDLPIVFRNNVANEVCSFSHLFGSLVRE